MSNINENINCDIVRKKVGFALGSGGAKGFAHIGVLQVLEENHIPIDMISGCSMGAIIASIYAVGTDVYFLEKYATNLDVKEYIDFKLHRTGGIIAGKKVEEIVYTLTHGKNIEDAKIPFLCVATDVEKGELVVFDKGPIHEAVRASMSIPAIFEPVRIDGRLLVDGGVLECVPCIPLKQAGADIIIGVDVGAKGNFMPIKNKSMFGVLNNALDIMMWEITKLRTSNADYMINPDTSSVGSMNISTSDAADMIKAGREACEKAIPEIKKLLKENGIDID